MIFVLTLYSFGGHYAYGVCTASSVVDMMLGTFYTSFSLHCIVTMMIESWINSIARYVSMAFNTELNTLHVG